MLRGHPSPIVIPLLALVLVVAADDAALAEPKYVGWTKVEACREIRELKEKVREGGPLDAGARAFLETTVLPQLGLQENRSLIEFTRRRIREVVLADVGDEKVYDEMAAAVSQFMNALARNDDADAVVRVNAMLLVGELKTRDGRPWPGAVAALVAAAADKTLPDAVRIAALAGVARHAEKVAGGEGGEPLRPAVTSILEQAAAAPRSVEQEWLVSRALQLLPTLVKPLPAKLAATVMGLVADETLPVELRVRAAAALGAAADASSGVDVAAVVEWIRKLALTALETEEKRSEEMRFEEQYRRGGALAAAAPPVLGADGLPLPALDPAAPSEQACRQAAWRLYTLGTAILSADGKQGLATLLGDAGNPAQELAKQLVEEGMRIDQTPDEDALLDALDVLRPPEPGDERPARQPDAAEQKPEPEAPRPAEPKPANPNASPFDNPFP